MPLSNRIETQAHVSTKLACYSDVRLAQLLKDAKPLHTGIGGTSALLTIDDTSIFVKRIPLTDLERQPQYIMSTANLFQLPLYHQYGVGSPGIGSPGFGAWRELVAHVITTNWVLSGECPNFPLMYHFRVLPDPKLEPMNAKGLEELDTAVQYWDDTPAIRKRFEAVHDASAQIVLFLEYVPENLHQWLGTQLKAGGTTAEGAISFTEENLKTINHFLSARGFCHFDAHFLNILTDGKLVYFSDFGLALSSKFDLTKAEIEFLNVHRTYDRCVTVANLVHCVFTTLCGKDQWEVRLREYISGSPENPGLSVQLAQPIAATIKRYAPISLLFMDEFYRKLQNETRSIPYPATDVERLLTAIDRAST